MLENEEERIPLTGLDSVIERFRRGGTLDQMEYDRRKHMFAATVQRAHDQDVRSALDNFYGAAERFLKNHGYNLRAACSNATGEAQHRSRIRNNTGVVSKEEEFFGKFLKALGAASQRQPIENIKEREFSDWEEVRGHFDCLKSCASNANYTRDLDSAVCDWESLYDAWMKARQYIGD